LPRLVPSASPHRPERGESLVISESLGINLLILWREWFWPNDISNLCVKITPSSSCIVTPTNSSYFIITTGNWLRNCGTPPNVATFKPTQCWNFQRSTAPRNLTFLLLLAGDLHAKVVFRHTAQAFWRGMFTNKSLG
jgi:hypothetical protein